MTDYSEESLVARIREARDSVIRVEGLAAYAVGGPEGDRLEAWRRGLPRPERSIRTDPYLRLVAETTARGVVWERLRMLGEPPSEYEEFQLLSYVEDQVVGEQVRVGARPTDWATPDCWLIDWEHAVVLTYDLDGRPTGMRLVDDVAGVNRILRDVEWLERYTVPLADYVAPRASRRVAG